MIAEEELEMFIDQHINDDDKKEIINVYLFGQYIKCKRHLEETNGKRHN